MPADIDEVRDLCDARELLLIEDAACAVGSVYKGRPIGGHSDIAVFSFHPRKLLTTGEGGMAMCRDSRLADRLRRLRQHAMSRSAFDRHGMTGEAEYDELGFNYRMTDIQAAMGIAQLARLEEMVSVRRQLADRYSVLLAPHDLVATPSDPPYGQTNYQSYAVIISERVVRPVPEIRGRLLDLGVSTRPGVMAAHREASLAGFFAGNLATTERIASRSLLLPMYHTMTSSEQEKVVECLISSL
jgi:perosamine synthetase